MPRALVLLCGTTSAACAAWAFWPLRPAPIDVAAPAQAAATSAVPDPIALDSDVFRTPIWVAERPPPPPPPAAPPPAPLKVQLLAIVWEGEEGVLKAVLYDPDGDKLWTAGKGDEVAGRTVDRVDKSAVRLRDAQGVRTLSLKDPGRSGL